MIKIYIVVADHNFEEIQKILFLQGYTWVAYGKREHKSSDFTYDYKYLSLDQNNKIITISSLAIASCLIMDGDDWIRKQKLERLNLL